MQEEKPHTTPEALPIDRVWRFALHSQRGLAHAHLGRPNEDAVARGGSSISEVFAVAVADGVGSGEHGDLASALVVRHWVDSQVPDDPAVALELGQQTLAGCEKALTTGLQAAGLSRHSSSGSMLVSAWLFPTGDVVLGHVGDCRAYRLHRGDLLPLTRDHSYRNLGLDAPSWRKADDPARMIGGGMIGPSDVQRLRLEPGDWLLLCSDGLHGALSHAQLSMAFRQILAACHPFGGYRKGLLQAICLHLAKLAVRAGGQDDISLALACFEGGGAPGCSPKATADLQKDVSESVWPSDVLGGVAS